MTNSVFLFAVLSFANGANAFVPTPSVHKHHHRKLMVSDDGKGDNKSSTNSLSSYEESDVSTKGLVSSLTGIVNAFMDMTKSPKTEPVDSFTSQMERTQASIATPPTTPEELLERIRDDYVLENYLWTGNIYLPAFEETCTFTDPTLSFQGRDKFVSNVQNLRPIVDRLITNKEDGCKSELLDIKLNTENSYVETRWNMIGDLEALPWQPRIDVIGRTKFWFRCSEQEYSKSKGYQVYLYDECWEIPAGKALLQLVTPRGTISNQP